MIFTNTKVKTVAREITEKTHIFPGQNLVGFRAHTVELDHNDLRYIVKNPDYALHILRCLLVPEPEPDLNPSAFFAKHTE